MKRHRVATSWILLTTKSKVVGCCRIGTVIIRGITFVYVYYNDDVCMFNVRAMTHRIEVPGVA